MFALLPGNAAGMLRPDFAFSTWDERTGEVRLMTSFDTTESEVDAFAAAVRRVSSAE